MVTAIAVILGVLLCLAVGAIVVLVTQLNRARDQIAELEQAIATGPGAHAQPAGVPGSADRRPGDEDSARHVEPDARAGRAQHAARPRSTTSPGGRSRTAARSREVAGPDGEVTIFFSDIENSTALNSELGDEEWVKLLAAHDRLLHTYVEKYGA